MKKETPLVRVVSATELVYQLMRRHHTGCTEWDGIPAADLPQVLRRRLASASEELGDAGGSLGNSADDIDYNTPEWRALNSATHWQHTYDHLLRTVIDIALLGDGNPMCLLRPLRTYRQEETRDPSTLFFLADSAVRWAKVDQKTELADDIEIQLVDLLARSATDATAEERTELEWAQWVLADLVRQFMLLVYPQWYPGQPPESRPTHAFLRGGKINARAIAKECAEQAIGSAAKQDAEVPRDNIGAVRELVEGHGRPEQQSYKALPGYYRTIYWLAIAIDNRLNGKNANTSQTPARDTPALSELLALNRRYILVDSEALENCLALAEEKRLPDP